VRDEAARPHGAPRHLRPGCLRPGGRARCPFLRHAAVHPCQTIVVLFWIALNAAAVSFHWDPYPFILLNLAFSTQAAYAAPLILLAQTRQAERDKAVNEKAEGRHAEAERRATDRVAALKQQADELERLLESNTKLTQQDKDLTEQIAALTREIHAQVTRTG